MIIDRVTNNNHITILLVSTWLKNTPQLIGKFKYISFFHVYREFNVEVDSLSKEALFLAPGSLHFMEFTEGECIGMGTF